MLGESIEDARAPVAEAPSPRAYASLADRLVAVAIDAVALSAIAFVAAIVVAVVLGAPVEFHDGATSVSEAVEVDRALAAIDALVVGALGALYCAWSWSRAAATPGQRLLGLQVVAERDAAAPSPRTALLRWLLLLAPFSLVAVLDAGIAGIGTPLWALTALWYLLLLASTVRDPAGRGWHDRAAGTVVTRPARLVGAARPRRGAA